MAIVHFDGFDMYNPTAGVDLDARGYTSINSHIFEAGRDGAGQAVKLPATSGSDFRITKALPAATNTLTVGFAFKCSTLSSYQSGKGIYLMYASGTSTFLGEIQVSNTGVVQYKTPGGVAAVASAAGAIVANVYHYIELEITRDSSAGSASLYLDGVLVGTATNINTGSAAFESVALYGDSQAGANQWYDDFYIKDTISHIGPVRCLVLPASSDTADADWTPSTGTSHAACVGEVPTNGDTDYVSAPNPGDLDIYNVTNFGAAVPTDIYAVQVGMVARKDDAAARTARSKLVSGATVSDGTTRTMTSGYVIYQDIHEVDPNTSAAWTVAGVNAAQIGVEVVS